MQLQQAFFISRPSLAQSRSASGHDGGQARRRGDASAESSERHAATPGSRGTRTPPRASLAKAASEAGAARSSRGPAQRGPKRRPAQSGDRWLLRAGRFGPARRGQVHGRRPAALMAAPSRSRPRD